MYNQLPEPTDEENDMLDLAFGLTETCVGLARPFPPVAPRTMSPPPPRGGACVRLLTHVHAPRSAAPPSCMTSSRLGCQVIVTPALRNMTVRLPSATRNMAVDGYKPKPH